ncbi:MAG TPA: hypothetical protein VI076_04855 [Actinopolymorphaceae bacterium]
MCADSQLLIQRGWVAQVLVGGGGLLRGSWSAGAALFWLGDDDVTEFCW